MSPPKSRILRLKGIIFSRSSHQWRRKTDDLFWTSHLSLKLELFSHRDHVWYGPIHIVTLKCMTRVTNILGRIEQGDPSAAEKLLPLVYEELRKLAAARMARERSDHTLQATDLVHEAYLRLVDVEKAQRWNSRGHFFGAAAEAMRRILVENARRKEELKHGGGLQRINLDQAAPVTNVSSEQLVSLDDALQSLERDDPEAAEVFKMKYFAGLSVEQAAEAIGISRATAYRHWTFARAWLQSRL